MQYPDVVPNYVSKLFNSCSSTFQHFYTVIQDKSRNSNVKHQTNDNPATRKCSSITKSELMKHSINVVENTSNFDIQVSNYSKRVFIL